MKSKRYTARQKEKKYWLEMERYDRLRKAINEKEEREGVKEPVELEFKVVHSYTMLTSKKYLGSDDEK